MEKSGNVNLWKNDLVKRYLSEFFSPHLPSNGELEIYERFLKQIKPGKALLLGATPTIRKILSRLGFKTTICDTNPEMIEAMDTLVDENVRRNENSVVCDWLETKFDNEFDVIIGDHTYSNLIFSNWERLSENMVKALKPGGHMIQNFVVKYDKLTTVEDIIEILRKNPAVFKDHMERWYYIYMVIMSDKRIYDDKTYTSYWSRYDKILENLKSKGKITEEEFNDLRTGVDLKGGLPPKAVVEAHLKKYFKILACEYSKERKVHNHYRTYFVSKSGL